MKFNKRRVLKKGSECLQKNVKVTGGCESLVDYEMLEKMELKKLQKALKRVGE